MKARITLALLAALSFAPFAMAGNTSLEQLAEQSGLTTRQVQMVIGAHTPHAEYRINYYRVRAQFIRAIGQEEFDALVKSYQDDQVLPGVEANG